MGSILAAANGTARRRSCALPLFGALSLLLLAIPCLASELDGITLAQDENGHKLYVNDSRAAHTSHRTSYLVYWSRAERRWKPVSAPSPSAMRAAKSAAAEVTGYVASKPSRPSAASVVRDPNYRALATGHAVSTAEIDHLINDAAARHGVDANLVRAVIKVESNFNPRAVSPKGAMGLMQLMPETARQLNVSNPFDPGQNVDAGVRHLKRLLTNYNGDLPRSLAAYNAGEKAVDRSNGVPHIAETQSYVKSIFGLYGGQGSVTTAAGRSFVPPAPLHVFRNPDGVLTITNTD
jgi:soluble lytic murein transglycosylase-like protein